MEPVSPMTTVGVVLREVRGSLKRDLVRDSDAAILPGPRAWQAGAQPLLLSWASPVIWGDATISKYAPPCCWPAASPPACCTTSSTKSFFSGRGYSLIGISVLVAVSDQQLTCRHPGSSTDKKFLKWMRAHLAEWGCLARSDAVKMQCGEVQIRGWSSEV